MIQGDWSTRRWLVGLVGMACFIGAVACAERPVYTDAAEAAAHAGFLVQGEYAGELEGKGAWGVQVAAAGVDEFVGMSYPGGLPGAGYGVGDEGKVELAGRGGGEGLVMEGAGAVRFRLTDGGLEALAGDGSVLGVLKRVERESETLGKEAPEGAVVLFDGSGVEAWKENRGMTDDGLLIEGAVTKEKFGDMQLHLEFLLPFMPGHSGQGRGNSGVYIMNRYEVQVLDSFGLKPPVDGAASLYRTKAADLNMSYPPLRWQTYDIDFRAPRFDEAGNKVENARVTVRHNGVVVQDDVELQKGTGAGGNRPEVASESLLLQNHSDPVRFRNVWLVEGEK
jgi:hypothetical protein